MTSTRSGYKSPLQVRDEETIGMAQTTYDLFNNKQEISKKTKVQMAINKYYESLREIKRIRSKEEKRRMVTRLANMPRPSYSRWVVKTDKKKKREKQIDLQLETNSKESSEDG